MSSIIPVEIVVDAERLQSPEALADLREKLADFSPILSEVGKVIEQGLLENFDSQGDGSWPALAPKTVAEKAHHGYPDTPELREGRLKAAATQRDAPGHIFTIGDNSVTVGVDTQIVPYAGVQNDGDPAKGIPPRILVQIGPGYIEAVIDLITEWLGGGEAVRVYVSD